MPQLIKINIKIQINKKYFAVDLFQLQSTMLELVSNNFLKLIIAMKLDCLYYFIIFTSKLDQKSFIYFLKMQSFGILYNNKDIFKNSNHK